MIVFFFPQKIIKLSTFIENYAKMLEQKAQNKKRIQQCTQITTLKMELHYHKKTI